MELVATIAAVLLGFFVAVAILSGVAAFISSAWSH